MNFAVIGDDPAMLPVARAIIDSPAHRLTHAVAPDESSAATMATASPSLRVVNDWEELLNVPDLDAVVVSTTDDATMQGVKQLASSGKSILLFPDHRQDPAWIYELTLIRDDNRVVLLPVFPLRDDPEVRRLLAAIAAGEIGKVLHLQMERETHVELDRESTPLLSVDAVNADLLADVDLLRAVGGDYNRITALHSGVTNRRLALATVTLAGSDIPESSWSARPVTTASCWTLRVVGETRQLTLSGRTDADDNSCVVQLDGSDVAADDATQTPSDRLLSRLEAAAAGEAVAPDWTDVTRDFEIIEATARSLRRRRTIDLHFETTSERNQFKTQMTAIGCGLVSMTMVSVIFLLIINAMFDVHPAVMSVARIGVFVPLGLFLLLQLLLFITRPPAD